MDILITEMAAITKPSRYSSGCYKCAHYLVRLDVRFIYIHCGIYFSTRVLISFLQLSKGIVFFSGHKLRVNIKVFIFSNTDYIENFLEVGLLG